jgi:HAD superfamily hydrolase (TIGR01509 family)
MIKAILWDNDGVLVDTERLYFRATRQILARVGVDLTNELYVELLLRQGRGAWHLARERGVPPSEIEGLRQERNDLYAGFLCQEPLVIDGAEETLARLHGRFVMGIVTSSRKDHFEIIHRSMNLLQYFDFVLTGDDYTTFKPDPEPYLLGVEKAGFEKHECLVVEDSERGLAAAKSAGLQCWVIPTELSEASDFSAADKVLSSITEVAAELLGGA